MRHYRPRKRARIASNAAGALGVGPSPRGDTHTRLPGADESAEAEHHIAEHSLGEAARIGRLSRIREFVLGAQDGLLVPLGVVTGMAAANPARSLIIVAGLAEAVAGAISMGGGSFLASQAEEQLYGSRSPRSAARSRSSPNARPPSSRVVLEREGLPRAQAETVARGLAAIGNVFLRTKVEKELGLSPDVGGAALGDAIVVGVTYLLAAVIPLWPYFLFALHLALAVSVVCTLVALFAVGIAKGRITRRSLMRSGFQVMVIGSVSAGVGFAIGRAVVAVSG